MKEDKTANTINFRTTKYAGLVADNLLARVNLKREELGKAPLSKSKLFEVAIENVTVTQGVKA
jgi:hypothetical protein